MRRPNQKRKRTSPKPRSTGGFRTQPSPEAVAARLKQAEIRLGAGQLKQLWNFHELLRRRNGDQELTRLIGFKTIVDKHYVDSLIVGNLYPLPSPLLDLGTGAGFPGIPLKIRFPDVKVILGEPRPKRVKFLEEAISRLSLRGISVFPHKVSSKSFTQPIQGVITRAVETMDKTLLRTSGALPVGGQILFMKGPNCDREIAQIEKEFSAQFRVIEDIPYRLPGTNHQRRLVVVERFADGPLKRS